MKNLEEKVDKILELNTIKEQGVQPNISKLEKKVSNLESQMKKVIGLFKTLQKGLFK
jgi:hypothetical protein